jgi:hypothetical protein
VVIFITLLAGFIPLLQVTFFALLEDLYPGKLAVKDRDKTHRITGLILIISYMHDAMIKILELFIKLKNIFNTHRTI